MRTGHYLSVADRVRPYSKLIPRPSYWAVMLGDSSLWVASVLGAMILRFEFDFSRVDVADSVILSILLAVIFLVLANLVGLYRSRFARASFDEFLGFCATAVFSGLVGFATMLSIGEQLEIPRSAPLIATLLFLVSAGAMRLVPRIGLNYRSTPGARRSLIYGAGVLGESVVRQLSQENPKKYVPVGLVDDDPRKSERWIGGVRNYGTLKDLARITKKLKAEVLIVAIPRSDSALLQSVRKAAIPLGIDVIVLPSFSEILDKNRNSVSFRKLEIDDLIGRRAVEVDSEAIRQHLEDRCVLITGAGGSIGLELCRQVSLYSPRRLVVLDRDETGLQQSQLTISGSGLLDSEDIVLADIRDAEAVQRAFNRHKPDVVFHAAALKHLPVLEAFPREAWKTNVLGTANVLSAASAVGVSLFVNISTDKAAEPTSSLGKSKRIAEGLTSWYSTHSTGRYHSVRFGNVLGSRGSLVPTLSYQIEAGGPVTLTDPDATRYFMTINEACQLVLQAATEHLPSAVLLLDMGEPVRIKDVAEKMIEMSGREIQIQYSGLRPGEKLHEILWTDGEPLEKSSHSLISWLKAEVVSPLDLEEPNWVDLTALGGEQTEPK